MNNLKVLREKAKKTQEEIADIIRISEKTYRDYENEKRSIPSNYCIMLSNYYSEIFQYNISVDYLLGLVECSFQDLTLRGFAEKTHLSDEAISNIIYEGSDKGDNSRIQALDLLLSDRETFLNLMDNIHALLFPPTMIIPIKPPFMFDEKHIKLTRDTLQQLSDYQPDNLYRDMRNDLENYLEKFSKMNEENEIRAYCPNEFHPIGL